MMMMGGVPPEQPPMMPGMMPQQPGIDPMQQQQPGEGRIRRDTMEPPKARLELVKEICEKVRSGKAKHESAFKRMRDDMDFVSGKQWEGGDEGRYVANITQRHIAQRVASLYCKNPKATAKRKKRLEYSLWSESMSELQSAQAMSAMAMQQGMPPDPNAMALMQDFQQGSQKRVMLDKVAKTLELVFDHVISEQQPNFKAQMKQLVRRVCVTGVGYVKIGFERVTERRPEDAEKIRDITEQIAAVERLTQDVEDGEIKENEANLERLRLMMRDLSEKPEVMVREGVVFDFPPSTSIIVDPKCRHLSSFLGAEWVAQEFMMSPDDIKEVYKVDIGNQYNSYKEGRNVAHPEIGGNGEKSDDRCCVWEVYSKKDRMKYVVVDGFHDFLIEPESPWPELEGFWPIFPLVFNEVENEKCIFPQSDVSLIRPIQVEYNRAREGLREHRHANRPAYAVPFGMMDEKDKINLAERPAHAIIELRGLQPGQPVDAILQHIKPVAIDPALYDTSMLVDDTLRILGSQEANIGGTAASGTTATEVSVAESSRMSAVGSNVDDLDEFLGLICRAAGQVMLKEFSQEYVTKVVGPGSVWPQFTREEISEQLYLDIEAGSSGRPNKAQELQNWERMAPILMQIPGIPPDFLAKETFRRLDDRLDTTDLIVATIPSIVAMNANQKAMAGDATATTEGNPNAQGPEGAQNAPVQGAAPGAPGPQTTDNQTPPQMMA